MRAKQNSVAVLAVTDHDTVDGLAEARATAVITGLTLIDAVEFSSARGERDAHILAYFVDPDDAALSDQLVGLREARLTRAREMVESLSRGGYPVDLDRVLFISAGGTVGRSHVARALVDAGVVNSTGQAFQLLIGRGRPFYVAKRSPSPEDVVRSIRDLNAIPVLAHPGVTAVDDLIGPMVDAGLLGIEAYHADHTPAQKDYYAQMAETLGLLVTGGSDFHGLDAPNADVGSAPVPDEAVERLLEAGERLRR